MTKNASLSDATPTLFESNLGEGEMREKESKLLVPAEAISQPATVSLKNGKLTVEANNSDLTQILQSLATISGMNIQGMNTGPRIFGVYGPGNAREVLSDLLAGSGYNFIMVGGSNGSIPHDLLLTAQNGSASKNAPRDSGPMISSASSEIESQRAEALQRSEEYPSSADGFGTGAISPAPSRNDQDSDSRMKQTLLRLQHMQEQTQNPTQ